MEPLRTITSSGTRGPVLTGKYNLIAFLLANSTAEPPHNKMYDYIKWENEVY